MIYDLSILEQTGVPNISTPLDAEVEVRTSKGKQKKITDLLRAINRSSDNLLLVLGDPGSGKSVSLRKLCQDLSKECLDKKTIPIYINLREWSVERKWDENNPPTVEQLYRFVVENIKSRDILLSKFFHRYFDKMYQSGSLYIVMDSFDEIPAVLDESENSELIHQLSDVIYRFLKGATRTGRTKAILSSRFFRKPTKEFHTNTILEIRPFNEDKIIQTLQRSRHISENIIRELFKEHPELETVARNPFSATLISEYVENNGNRLPPNQYEMYADYIRNTLESCYERISKRKLTVDLVIESAIKIATEMFDNYGLEAPVNKLAESLKKFPIDDVIDILKFARLGRGGTGDENQFSFSHRRFTEYFAIQNVIENDISIDLESIPTDSQWRDALVLYCEVANKRKATSIAEFCWKIIKTTNNPMDLRVIHSMRFLRDAFKGRLDCIKSFRKELAEYIANQLNEENSILSTKLAVETVGLLYEKDIDNCILSAMELDNSWINQSAFQSCRNLPSISSGLEDKIYSFLLSMSLTKFVKDRRQLIFSLQLSEAFRKIFRLTKWKYYHILFSVFSLLILFLLTPHFIIFSIVLFSILYVTNRIYSIIQGNSLAESNILIIEDVPLSISGYWFFGFLIALVVMFFYLINTYDFVLLLPSSFLLKLLLIVTFLGPFNFFREIIDIIGLSVFVILLVSFLIMNFPIYEIFFINWTSSITRLKKGLVEWLKEFNSLQWLKKILRDFLLGSLIAGSIGVFFGLHIYIASQAVEKEWLSHLWFKLLGVSYISIWFIVLIILFLNIVKKLGSSIRESLKMLKMIFTEINHIDYTKLNQREYIYETLKKIRFGFNRNKIFTYLENEIKEVHGEWPDTDIFKINSPFSSIRLAKLEEKWLGLDR